MSVFEFNIRFIGGLLTAYALSGDEVHNYVQCIYTFCTHPEHVNPLNGSVELNYIVEWNVCSQFLVPGVPTVGSTCCEPHTSTHM